MSELKKIQIGDWRIRDDEDGEYVITHSDGSGVVLSPSGKDQSISDRLFWRFIRDLLCDGEKLAAAPDLYEALEPFAQEGYLDELGGNVQGDDSPIFERQGCRLTLGDFRRAAKALAKARGES